MTELTARQLEVAALVADGVSTKRIACKLGVSDRRVYALITSVAYLIGADPNRDERTQIAEWWRAQAA